MRANRKEYQNELSILEDLRNKTDLLRPFDILERILTKHKGRKDGHARDPRPKTVLTHFFHRTGIRNREVPIWSALSRGFATNIEIAPNG